MSREMTGEQCAKMLERTAEFLDAHRGVGCQSISLGMALESPTIEVWVDLVTSDQSLIKELGAQPLKVIYDEGTILYSYMRQHSLLGDIRLDPNRVYASDCVDVLARVVRSLPLPVRSVNAFVFEGLRAAIPILKVGCQPSSDEQVQKLATFLRDNEAILDENNRPSIAAYSQRHHRQLFAVMFDFPHGKI